MAWTVNIDEIIKEKKFLIVRLTLTDGTVKIRPDEYHVTTELELKQRINAEIARLTVADIDFPKIAPGLYDPTIPPPPPPPPPPVETQEQKDRRLYSEAIGKLRHLLSAVSLVVIDSGDQDITDTRQYLIDHFTDAYLTLF